MKTFYGWIPVLTLAFAGPVLADSHATAPKAADAPAANVGNIEVIIDVKDDSGQVFASLFNKAESFPGGGEPPFKTAGAQQKDGKARIVFENVPYGEYAIAAHHDEDGNGKMKTVYGSIPLEGIGVSRDAKGVMGPPKFEDAKFRLDAASVSVEVHVNY